MADGAIDYRIEADDITRDVVRDLLRLHVQEALSWSPPSTGHAMEPEALIRPDIAPFTAWDGEHLAACGALVHRNETLAEIKAMRAAPAYRGKGAGAAILAHLIATARERNYRTLGLETGNSEGFQPAIRLYERFGFAHCPPFGDYVADGFSVCMKLEL